MHPLLNIRFGQHPIHLRIALRQLAGLLQRFDLRFSALRFLGHPQPVLRRDHDLYRYGCDDLTTICDPDPVFSRRLKAPALSLHDPVDKIHPFQEDLHRFWNAQFLHVDGHAPPEKRAGRHILYDKFIPIGDIENIRRLQKVFFPILFDFKMVKNRLLPGQGADDDVLDPESAQAVRF